jgi:hypothetical protein
LWLIENSNALSIRVSRPRVVVEGDTVIPASDRFKRSSPEASLDQAALWRFDAFVAFAFVALVFLIAAGSAWEWWKLLRGTKRIVLHESEFIPLSRVESSGV